MSVDNQVNELIGEIDKTMELMEKNKTFLIIGVWHH